MAGCGQLSKIKQLYYYTYSNVCDLILAIDQNMGRRWDTESYKGWDKGWDKECSPEITLPSVLSDRLIFVASFNLRLEVI